MKKLFLSMLMLATVSVAMAQTPEEKAAAKAEAAAQKAAEKLAKGQVAQGVKLRDQITLLHQANQTEKAKGPKANEALIANNQVQILAKAQEANAILREAFDSGNIPVKSMFEAGKAFDDVSTFLLNPQLEKASQHMPFDTIAFANAVDGVCRGCYAVILHGKEKDELQKPTIVAEKLKMPKLITYRAYQCMFMIEKKDLDAAEVALESYVNFGKDYPLVANEPEVKNPQYPASQFGFNIYLTAFNQKRYDICEKYYELAASYDDSDSHNFVVGSRPQIYLNQGDTANWVKCLKDIAIENAGTNNADVATQNLMVYYSKKGGKELNDFADEMLAATPNNKIACYGKGFYLFQEEKYEEAFGYYDKALEIDCEYYDALYMAGMSMYRLAVSNNFKYIDGKKYKTQKEMSDAEEKYVKKYFRKAQPYFEKSREMAPEKSDDWANPLITIYKNTNQADLAKELQHYIK